MRVACAIIISEGKVLLTQRSATMPLPLMWEFPGGKVEPGESEEQCIVREIHEELGVQIEIIQKLDKYVFDENHRSLILVPFLARIKSGTITLSEHVKSGWYSPENWNHLNWAPADIELSKAVSAILTATS